MLQTVSMLDLRKRPGEIVNLAYYQKNTILLKRGNKTLAALVPIDFYQSLFSNQDIELYTPERIKEFEKEDRLDKKTAARIKKQLL